MSQQPMDKYNFGLGLGRLLPPVNGSEGKKGFGDSSCFID